MSSETHMGWTTIELDSVAPTPWRNGGGVTRELVAWPSVADWAWRLSVAEVTAGGPFSVFEGVERWFAVLQGAGVGLDVAGDQHRLTAESPPLRFDGGVATACALLAGATQDLNLMLRAGRASGTMQRVQGQLARQLDAPMFIAIYALQTGTTVTFDNKPWPVPPRTLAWREVPAPARVQVASPSAVWMEIRT